jgi:hypothetical protein
MGLRTTIHHEGHGRVAALQQLTRRHFFHDCGVGLGQIALASLLARDSSPQAFADLSGTDPLLPKSPHYAARARRVIFLFMTGAPSQLELFDYKPRLAELEGQPLPPSVLKGQRYAFIQPDAAVMGPQFKFARHGETGVELSELLPHLAQVVDQIAIVRSVHTSLFNHAPAQLFLNTGHGIPGRPSMGAWLSYGIGSDANDLPSFVVLVADSGGGISGGAALWSSGCLPSSHQGVAFRSAGDPILHVSSPPGIDRRAQRDSLDFVRQLNEQRLNLVGDPEIQTRINSYEMAYRMQSRAPELMDFSQESAATLEMYGAKPGDPAHVFANNCLMARRLVERGVRFVQVYHGDWDQHNNLNRDLKKRCQETDQASAALILDLKQRGLLDDTLVVWGGDFGRTPMVQGRSPKAADRGRDHHPQAFTMWFAGGGIKAGVQIGQTDELGFHILESPHHIHDVQATILHLMGLDHTRLSVRVGGLDVRLTGVEEHHPIAAIVA